MTEKLHANQKTLLEAVWEYSADSMRVTDSNGIVISVNNAYCKMTGFEKDDILGKPFTIVYDKKGQEELLDYYLKFISSDNITERNDKRVTFKNGKHCFIEASYSHIEMHGEKYILAIIRDITEFMKAVDTVRESEKTFRKLFEESADPILLLDESGFVDCNTATISLLGYSSKEDFLNKQPWELSPEKQPDGRYSSEKAVAMINKARQDGNNRFEWIHQKSDGTDFPVEVMLTPILLNKKQHYYTIWRDISERKQVEVKIREQSERIGTILRTIPDLMFIIDKNGYYKEFFANESSSLAIPPDKIIGANIKDVFGENELKVYFDKFEKCFETGRLQLFEYQLTINNELRYFEARISRLDNENILSIVRDITKRKQAEENLENLNEQLTCLIESIPDSIFFKDGEGRLLITNEPAKDLFKLHDYDWYGKTNDELANEKPDMRYFYENCLYTDKIAWKEKILTMFEVEINSGNSETHYFEVRKVPLFENNGKRRALVIVGSDITERKNIISELKLAKETAEASDKLKSAFLNNISHEIRTPLNGILGFGEILMQNDITDSERAESFELLKLSSQRLLNTITDYVDSSMLSSGNMKIRETEFPLDKLLNKLRNKFRNNLREKNLNYIESIQDGILNNIIKSDFLLIEKVLSQLIDNAIKFTDRGFVTLNVSINSGSIEFCVKDTGIGITKNAQGYIFEQFSQVSSGFGRSYEGNGLGLSIAKGITGLIQGKIWLESNLGEGSSFYFVVPFKGEENKSFQKDSSGIEYPEITSPVILIAEDDKSNSKLYETLLLKKSIKYLIVSNGAEAIEKCKSHPEINLVIMDLKMPVIGGIEATKQIKKFRKDLPIIAVTAYASSYDETEAFEAGCDDYISKPLDSDVLWEKLSKFGILTNKKG